MVLFNVVVFALMAGLVIGVVLRFWTVTLPAVTLAKVTPPYAEDMVGQFLEGSTETRFGFPSGVFRVDPAKSHEGSRLTVREVRPDYSVTDGCAAVTTAAGVGMIADADGCFEAIIAFTLTALIAGPVWALNLTEKMYRRLLQSEVRADLAPVTDPDGTEVTIRLRGVSALFLRKAYEDALHKPKLPDDIAVAAGVVPPPPALAPSDSGSRG